MKSRDNNFNEDPAPALISFTVIPPVWQQPWFIVTVAVFFGAIATQTMRVIRRDRRLLAEVTAFRGDAPQGDDMTFVVMRDIAEEV